MRGLSLIAVAAVMLAAWSLAPGATRAQAAAQAGADQTYVLGNSDVIEVSVLGHPDFLTRGRIGEDGTVQLPYIGGVVAAKKTARQLGDEVSRLLDKGGFYSHAIVKVDIVSFASRYVTVLGEVQTPGLIPTDRAYRLSEIIARVGGVKDTGADYVVLRPAQGPERDLTIKELATGGEAQDPYVAPGDKIYVPKADIVYVSGQGNTPGAFPLISDMTVRMAIGRAGGVSPIGTDKKLRLTRHGVRLPHVDLNDKIEAGDVLVVGERLF